MGKCEAIRQRLYTPERYDNDLVFLRMIESCIGPGSFILDLGAGAGLKFKYNLKFEVKPGGKVTGADYDPRVRRNQLLDRGVVMDGPELPFSDNIFDVVFTRYVLEHVGSPQSFLREVRRVLKAGGSFVFLTPNKWHYVSIASRCTPQAFHRLYNRWRGRDEMDTFPTLYRLNTLGAIRHHFRKAGLCEKELTTRECCPNYLTLAAPLFLVGVAYERLVNSSTLFAGLRVNILGHFLKPKVIDKR